MAIYECNLRRENVTSVRKFCYTFRFKDDLVTINKENLKKKNNNWNKWNSKSQINKKAKFFDLLYIYYMYIYIYMYTYTRFFYKQRFSSTQPQCCLTFLWIELQLLLSCCLTYKNNMILRHFLYFSNLFSCLELSLFMS